MKHASMKRISASVPDRVFEQLEDLAKIEGRSFSNLVSYLLERCVDARFEMNQAQGRISGLVDELPANGGMLDPQVKTITRH